MCFSYLKFDSNFGLDTTMSLVSFLTLSIFFIFPSTEVAFSELIDHINNLVITSLGTPVFMMKDLRSRYEEILEKHGSSKVCVNVTRLKENILTNIPYLIEGKSGKYTILTSQDLGEAIYKASNSSSNSEGSIIFNAAKVMRKYLFDSDAEFNGDLSR